MWHDFLHKLLTVLAKYRALQLYIAKCCAGVVVVHVLALFTRAYIDPIWCHVSLILVLTPDSKEAMPLAVARMKANICGVIAAIAVLSYGVTNTATLCVAFAIAIVLCHLWDVMTGVRSAMAATAIILWHEPGAHPHVWEVSSRRLVAVALGCFIGLVLTFVFHRNQKEEKPLR